MEIDRIDAEILRILQKDVRRSNKQIAADVGLAPSSVHDRIRRLWAEGILTGAHAEVSPQVMGVGLEALLMLELAKHERATVDGFLDEIAEVPEVRSARLITGRYDVVVHVVVRDMRHLKDLAFDHFTSRAGVTRVETSIIYDSRVRWVLPQL